MRRWYHGPVLTPTGTIKDIIPEARGAFRALLAEAGRRGLQPKILSAGRTCADQNRLKGQGSAVTGASGCQSWHVLGRALDVRLVPGSCATYRAMGQWWEAQGGFWGGRWTHFGECGDAMHFHWPEEGYAPGVPPGCPSDPNQCEAYREAYLREAFGLSPWLAVGTGLAAAAAYVAWKRR